MLASSFRRVEAFLIVEFNVARPHIPTVFEIQTNRSTRPFISKSTSLNSLRSFPSLGANIVLV